jgi:hypothetical protein
MKVLSEASHPQLKPKGHQNPDNEPAAEFQGPSSFSRIPSARGTGVKVTATRLIALADAQTHYTEPPSKLKTSVTTTRTRDIAT